MWNRTRAEKVVRRLMREEPREREYIRESLEDLVSSEEEFQLFMEQGLGYPSEKIAALVAEVKGGAA